MASFRGIFVIFIISVVSNIFTISRVEISWGVGIVRESSQPGSKTINTNPFRQLWVVMSATMWPVYVIVTTKPPGLGHIYIVIMTSQSGLRDLHLYNKLDFFKQKRILSRHEDQQLIHSFVEFSCNFPEHKSCREVDNKQDAQNCVDKGRVAGNGKCSNESHFALGPALHHLGHNIHYITQSSKTERHGVINMANFLVNYWLTRTNNCLIIIPARLPTPVAGRHFSSEIGKISFQFDCWLLAGLYGGLYEPFSHCRTDSVSNSFIACIK